MKHLFAILVPDKFYASVDCSVVGVRIFLSHSFVHVAVCNTSQNIVHKVSWIVSVGFAPNLSNDALWYRDGSIFGVGSAKAYVQYST